MPQEANTIRFLVVDDQNTNLELIAAGLQQEGLEVFTSQDSSAGFSLFQQVRPHIALVEVRMLGIDGIELMQRMIALDPGLEVILMTGHYSIPSAVDAIRKGATDYLAKPINITDLQSRIRRLIELAHEKRKALRLEQELVDTYQFEGLVGRSPLMLAVFAKIRRIAPHFRTVLIQGATGTGKELVARALHHRSPVARKALVTCNCSAITESLLESELFGHVRGAFTGAVHDKPGLFEYADGGTVFLDEIGDMPLAGQSKLLRVLQNQEIQRVGSPAVRRIAVNVVAATNRDLRTMVREGRFREDLYYRLASAEIELPSLAERGDDLRLLQHYFLQKFSAAYGRHFSGISRRAQISMTRYSWPGNVRELENVLANACMMAESEVLDIHDIAPRILQAEPGPRSNDPLLSMEEVQQQHIARVLQAVRGDKRAAAEILGIGLSTLYAFLAKQKGNKENPGESFPATAYQEYH